MKKITLTVLIATALSVASAFAQDCDYSGTTGPLNWCLKDSTLTISGEGEMPDYSQPDLDQFTYPWYDRRGSVKNVVIKTGVTTIGNNAFNSCWYLTSIAIPNGVTRIGYATFRYTSLTSIIIPDGVTTIGKESFSYCTKLTSVTLPNSVTSIGSDAFLYCNHLTSITIPKGVTRIEEGTFAICGNLTSITIPNSVTSIGRIAFALTALPSIIIPSSVTSIGEEAFYRCTSLTLITNLNSVPVAINSNVFEEMDQNKCTLEVPMGSVSAYKNAKVWKEFNIVGIDVGIEPITNDELQITVFPNPTRGELIINNEQLTIKNIDIFDVFGRSVYITHPPLWGGLEGLDISHLPAGIYFIRITTEKGVAIKKNVKM